MIDRNQPAYKDFRNIFSERVSKIVVWVGSGLSRPAGLPTWTELRDSLCTSLSEKARSFKEDDELRVRKIIAQAKRQSDLWVALEILKKEMGNASFKDCIRSALRPADIAVIPEAYKEIWRLRPAGILSLNLDRLVIRAHSEVYPGKPVDEFVGGHAGQFMHLLRSSAPFVANLHGIAAQADSWVLTKSDLRSLLGNKGYLEFLRSCLASSTVLFVGLSADDVAVGGHLARLTDAGVDFGSHFWVTDRRDPDTDRRAERAGLRLIRYEAVGGEHVELSEFFEDLLSFVSHDDEVPPVVLRSSRGEGGELPPQGELLAMKEPDRLRRLLNAYASGILASHSTDAYKRYDEFSKEYDQAIYRAWYIGTSPPSNRLLSYSLLKEIARGAFGRVFEARDSSGSPVAVKVLHQEVRESEGMLQSFRRGVRSMKILSDHGVKGMVPYRDASEIPAFVVMDLVDGPNLKEVVQARQVEDWNSIIKIALSLVKIIRSAHLLPERVLHRDIRPSNIMLPRFYRDVDDWEVAVLDFDLSWHKDALERSVAQGNVTSGYLAPEQVHPERGVSTRSAAVDSYGIGMTLFFLVTGVEPVIGQHKHADWRMTVEAKLTARECDSWQSLPSRFARLILSTTRDSQSERWDLAQVEGELETLEEANKRGHVNSAELVAEELAARTGKRYFWNEDARSARIETNGGVRLSIESEESRRVIIARIERLDKGMEHRKKLEKWVEGALDRAAAVLKKGKWRVKDKSAASRSLVLLASATVDDVGQDLDRFAASLTKVVDDLSFT